MNRPTIISLMAGFAAAFAVAASASSGGSATPRLTFSESYRYENRTISDGNSSSTETASRDSWTINAEIPMSELTNKTLDHGTEVKFAFGSFKFEGRLGDDPKFSDGAKSARLAKMIQAGSSQMAVATAEVKWDDKKLTLKMSAKLSSSENLIGPDYQNSSPGKIDGQSQASITLGDQVFKLVVPYSGKVDGKHIDTGGLSGGYTTVEVKGDSNRVKN